MQFSLIELEGTFLAYNSSYISTLQEIALKASITLLSHKLGHINEPLKIFKRLFIWFKA
jgi:hypothetical protein